MTPDSSLFGGVLDWFLGRGGRDRAKRRSGAFRVYVYASAGATPIAGVGTEISASDLLFIVPKAIDAPDYNVALALRERRIPVRVKTVGTDVVDYKGEKWHRYKAEFQGIAADHWDAIVRYVDDRPELENRAQREGEELAARSDDAYRLLPLSIQEKFVQHLVRAHKLEEPKPGQTPLLKLFYGGLVKQAGKSPAHRFNVHSRIVRDGESFDYDTSFLVTETGEITTM